MTTLKDKNIQEGLAAMFKALGDPTRLGIALALKDRELCVSELSHIVGVSESAASHQLRSLRLLRLVKRRRDGQKLYYSLDDDHVEQILNIGIEHQKHL